jgi:hypothetical protein
MTENALGMDAEPLLASSSCKFRDSRRTVVRILRRIKQLPLAEQCGAK